MPTVHGERDLLLRSTSPSLDLKSPMAAAILADIVYGLQPSMPTVCVACVFLVDHMGLHPDVYDSNVCLLRTHHPLFLTRCMAYVTVDRHQHATPSLESGLRSIMHHCPHRMDSLHSQVVDDFCASACTQMLAESLCAIVNCCFPTITARSIEAKKFTFGKLWPSSSQDLLPQGSDGFRGLLYWLPASRDVAILSTLTRVFLWCYPQFYQEFAKDSSRSFLWHSLCGFLDATAAALRDPHLPAPNGRGDPGHRLTSASHLLELIAVYSSETQWTQLVDGCGSQLLSSVTSALSAYREDLSVAKSRLLYFASAVRQTLGQYVIPVDIAYHEFHEVLSFTGSYAHFRHFLLSLLSRRTCSMPDCPTKPLQAVRLSVCASCHVLRYCSRDCQRRHWRCAVRPHRSVCKRVGEIVARASPTGDPRAFEDECRSQQLDAQQLAVIYGGMIAHDAADATDHAGRGMVAGTKVMLEEMDLLHEFHSALHGGDQERLPAILQRLDDLPLRAELREQTARYIGSQLRVYLDSSRVDLDEPLT